MKLDGEYSLSVSRDKLFPLLMDPDVIAAAVPGCEELTPVGEDEYASTLTIGIAAVKGVYTSKIKILDKNEPESFGLHMEGKGARGFLNGTVKIELAEQDASTVLHYAADTQVGGPIAAVGQRIVGAAAKMLVNQGLKALEKEVLRRLET